MSRVKGVAFIDLDELGHSLSKLHLRDEHNSAVAAEIDQYLCCEVGATHPFLFVDRVSSCRRCAASLPIEDKSILDIFLLSPPQLTNMLITIGGSIERPTPLRSPSRADSTPPRASSFVRRIHSERESAFTPVSPRSFR
jgi:hypothetical protein